MKVRLLIERDELAECPRKDRDNAGHMICWHPSYELGDKHNFEDPNALNAFLNVCEVVVKLPLFLYDHSGISMSATRGYPFNCPWDSGQVGVIYMNEYDIRREYDVLDEEAQAKALEVLYAEVATYNQYIMGDVFGFVLEKLVVCDTCKNEEWENIDSCWGFFGYDPKESGMIDYIDDKYQFLLDYVGETKEVSDEE